MARTTRKAPFFRNLKEDHPFVKKCQRGHVSIDKVGDDGDSVWGRNGKRARKKLLTRKARRNQDIPLD